MARKLSKKDLKQQDLLHQIASLKPKLKSFEEIVRNCNLYLKDDLLLEEIILIDDMNTLS